MKLTKKILIILLLALPVMAIAGYLFKTLDAKDGLTSSQINCIIKDSRGFMWMGTPAGLYRYDGYAFRHFQSDSQDGASLPNSYIYSIQELSKGVLWIKTPAGYCVYNPQTESFERDMNQTYKQMGIDNTPSIVYIDSHQNIWANIPKKKVVCFNTQQQLLSEYPFSDDSNSLPQGNVCSISECKDGAIIVYDDGRLVCLAAQHQQYIVWQNQEIAQKKLRKSTSLNAFADQMDNIWLYGQGTLFVLNKKTQTWDTAIGNQLNLTSVNVDHSVNSMAGDRKGNIWIGTNRNGLIKVNVNTHAMEEIPSASMSNMRILAMSPDTKAPRIANGIQSVYVDDTDLLWVGTAKSGVAYWGENIYKFLSSPIGDVTAIAQDSTGNLIYGTSDNGIIDYEGPLASLCVTSMAITPDGSLWVGSKQNGLTRIQNGTAKIYSNNTEDGKLIDNHINALCTDGNGNLWIATDEGLQNYNPRMNTFASYTKTRNNLQTNTITTLCFGKDNNLLIGTSEGLSIMNLSNAEIIHLTGNRTNMKRFTNSFITQVYQDSRKLLWIGTREGLNVLNLENDELDYITERQELCNNNICGISEDLHHNMWITTSNGVCRIVVDYHEGKLNYGLYNYNQNDGLQGNEFNLGSIITKKDGHIVMGGIYGTSRIRPKSDDEKAALPKVILTQLFVGEEEIHTGVVYHNRVILPQALNESPSIRLKHDENTFTIKFAAGNYNQSERLQFHYRLVGYNDTYVPGNAMRHCVTFNDLSSGTYELHVKASSAESNVQSSEETILTIEIEPAWYWQWWMKATYILILFIIFYLWKKGFDQIKILWNKKKAIIGDLIRQREEIKATGDDLRQPMARMTSIIMNLAEKEGTLEEREQLNNLHSQMLQIITRVSDMQAMLEHPEELAKKNVHKHFELDSHGELNLPDVINEELTYEIRPHKNESPVSGFKVFFIDDNEEFTNFINSRLRYIYEFRTFSNIHKASAEIETTQPDLVICKQDMADMTGSDLCNKIKMDLRLYKIKFVLMTEGKLSSKEMMAQNITMSADDYLAKPFNLQDAVMHFNKLLGIGTMEMASTLIEGAETRMLEDRNSSMTTASETIDYGAFNPTLLNEDDEEIKSVSIVLKNNSQENQKEDNDSEMFVDSRSMSDVMDQRFIASIEQYVQQNMSRGQINLEEMATAMGMAMRPFFQKTRDLTGKTPSEIVRDLKLKNACILLKRTNINMNELATNVGFATGDYFIKIFKERFGILPTEYRQRYRK